MLSIFLIVVERIRNICKDSKNIDFYLKRNENYIEDIFNNEEEINSLV